ncbi:small ribosomal subunit protein mS31 [Bacillus rossius redtenbacheri]|uniref:small ribosomal subunit protein mS31 n=1 Tax=Bacillus rossius redtenbacheri TaxID=93214 RepID=UPI002FDE3210
MLTVCSAVRFTCRQFLHFKQPDKVLAISRYFGSQSDDSDSSSDDDEDKKTPKDANNAETLRKLNMLINSMIEKEFSKPQLQSAAELKLAQPKRKRRKEETKKEEQAKLMEDEKFDQSLESAARDVAETLSGDAKQTEKELLQKLLYRSGSDEPTTEQEDTTSAAKPAADLGQLIAGMKVEQAAQGAAPPGEGRAQQVRKILSRRGGPPSQQRDSWLQREERDAHRQKPSPGRVSLFEGKPLGIFTPVDKSQPQKDEAPVLETWQRLRERELKLAVTHPPSNVFEEMIQWTEQGKLWKFPINNEQGMEEEAKVFFADHVFLERHLEPWCPPRGPIRHFMELVCVGLSKNPYITVRDKREHLEWYRDYFEGKRALLAEVGALGDGAPSQQDPGPRQDAVQ